jgi:hypothetical protein
MNKRSFFYTLMHIRSFILFSYYIHSFKNYQTLNAYTYIIHNNKIAIKISNSDSKSTQAL